MYERNTSTVNACTEVLESTVLRVSSGRHFPKSVREESNQRTGGAVTTLRS